jgi:hypothetical protein
LLNVIHLLRLTHMILLRSLAFRARFVLAACGYSLIPAVAFAQSSVPNTTGANNLGSFLLLIIYMIDVYIVPVIFALAFIVFVWGIYRTFIAGATSDEKRQEGQKLVVYGLIGFVLMFSVWGLVNLLVGTLGFNGAARPSLPVFNPTDSSASPTNNSFTNTTNTNSNTSSTPTPADFQGDPPF